MPTPQQKTQQPDFIPADPDFIPADSGSAPSTPTPQMSGLQKFAEALLPHSLMHPVDAANEEQQQRQAHPIRSMVDSYPPVAAAEGLYGGAKRSGSELMQGAKSLIHGNPWYAISHGVKAIPFAGPAISDVADNPDVGGTGNYMSDLASVVKNPSAMGELTGAAAQMAPIVAGGADMAAPDRSLMGQIPTKARAGAVLESLDKKLANAPVKLSNSVAPLQRATELSVRTGASPSPFNAFLTRSQSPIDMTFPEARDYQSGMANSSVMDRLATSGKMRGAVKQLNKNFFTDIQDAANAHTPGLGDDYAKGMSDYKNAARLSTAAKMAGIGAATAVAGPSLFRYLKPLIAE
jgi:hypothetical protein